MFDPQLTISLTKEQTGSVFVGFTIIEVIYGELFGQDAARFMPLTRSTMMANRL